MSEAQAGTNVTPIRWIGTAERGHFELLEQRALPTEERWVPCRSVDDATAGIRDMIVRGAPAIGVTAAFGVVLAAQELVAGTLNADGFIASLQRLLQARPTAVNLAWAVDRMERLIEDVGARDVKALWDEAEAIRLEDLEANRRMGQHGAALMPDDARILTICNTGSLATAGIGTALGVIRAVHAQGRLKKALACETRPYLQGARLTMWELHRDGIPSALVTDGMPGHLMQRGEVDAVIAGADRIAANGDAANKIGTYQLAVLAKHHGIPFYIAAPLSTIDRSMPTGAGIPIEQRGADEVTLVRGVRIAPEGIEALHPAFDVTPAELIAGIVTEAGVARASYGTSIAALFG